MRRLALALAVLSVGTLGLLAGIGLLAIPGVGPFIAAGPIMAALSGIAVGAAVGGIAGALIGMGIPEIEAKRYEGKVKDGNILISVHAETSEMVSNAKRIFENGGAMDISSGSEANAPAATNVNNTNYANSPGLRPAVNPTCRQDPVVSNSPGFLS